MRSMCEEQDDSVDTPTMIMLTYGGTISDSKLLRENEGERESERAREREREFSPLCQNFHMFVYLRAFSVSL